MVPYNYPEFIDGLTDLVNKNVIPMSRIDDAVSRILRVKFTLGLFENPMADNSLADMLGAQVSYLISQTNRIFFFSYIFFFGNHIPNFRGSSTLTFSSTLRKCVI